jgi:hypothetical protein
MPRVVESMSASMRDATKRKPEIRVSVQGFEGTFQSVQRALQSLSEQDLKEAGFYTIELTDTPPAGERNAIGPMVIGLTVKRHGGGELTLRGGDRWQRNGLRPELKRTIEHAKRTEARRRWERRLAVLGRENALLVLTFLIALAAILTLFRAS